MKSNIETLVVAAIVFAAALGFSGGATARWFGPLPSGLDEARASVVPIPDTPIDVALSRPISSETARPGDVWRGTVIENVVREHGVWIPSGTRVTGIVTAVRNGRHGSRAMLELTLRALELPGPQAESADAPGSGLAAAPASVASDAVDVPVTPAALSIPATSGSDAVTGVVQGTPASRVMAVWSGVPIALREGAVMTFSVDHTVAVR